MGAVLALKARVSWGSSVRYSSEERLRGLLHATHHVLSDRGMHLGVFGAHGFPVRQFRCLLLVTRPDALAASPPRLALFQGHMVERAT
jgi:hypothetical protein